MSSMQTALVARRDPAPLSYRQLRTVGVGAAREMGWGLRGVRGEIEAWRRRALAIPDPWFRRDALCALADKRSLVDGAALFWILPACRQPRLLRLLVALQTLANFHDHASERVGRGGASGPGSSMRAFLEVVDVDRPLDSYRGENGGGDDGGYLRALAQTCRAGCATLPHYGRARGMLVQETRRAQSLDLEHEPDPRRRAQLLEQIAAREFGGAIEATWWELTAGTSSLLTVIVLLALVADEQCTEQDLRDAVDAYRWVASASGLLDSYTDQFDDARSGTHNYLAYYRTPEVAAQRLGAVIDRALRGVAALRNGDRHLVIVASMVASFLSSEGARNRSLRASTRALVASGGTLTRVLVPILRAWRIAYGQPAA
jgi:tetraprenyl-beta-curcumene synthase